MKKYLLFLLLILFSALVYAEMVSYTYQFSAPSISYENGNAIITLPDCWTTGLAGQPALPLKGCKLLLPPGKSAVSVAVETAPAISLGLRFYVAPVQLQHPLSQVGPFPPTPENPEIYNVNQFYPQNLANNLLTNYKKGYSIGTLSLSPLAYNPVSGELVYYPWIKVNLEVQSTTYSSEAYDKFFRASMSDQEEIGGIIDNLTALNTYNAFMDDPADNIDFLIITHSSLEANFQELAMYKTARGTSTEIVLIDYIISHYTGVDTPDKIRNCVGEYYEIHNTDYALIAGDNEFIPKRSLYASAWGVEIDPDIATDMYFGCLDGNWNNDGDPYWGEPGEADLMAEVYVGRAAVDSPTEADNFVHKQIMYQQNPVVEEITDALMVGEDLGWISWGSQYKDEIRYGSSNWGYTTAGFPTFFDVGTLYDTPAFNFTAMGDLLPLLNQGPQLVNHLGHANTNYALKFGTGSINDINMTNNGENHNFYIIFSQGCYCNSWDNRETNFTTSYSDCISEKWTTIANGAVCFVGNVRYGWGDYGSTNGASQYLDRRFFDAIFGENIRQIGRALQDAKEECIPIIAEISYYVYYETCLLGDPSLEIWNILPQTMTVVCDTSISLNDTVFVVSTPGVANAIASLSQDGVLLGSASTGSLGPTTIHLTEPILSTTPVQLMVIANQYLPYNLYLDVYTPNSPNIICTNFQIDDANGDNDGILDLGEVPYIDLTIMNFGGVNANSVNAYLESESDFIDIEDGSQFLGLVMHDFITAFNDPFQISISPDIPDEQELNFTLRLIDGQNNEWSYNYAFQASAPEIFITNVVVNDGNDNRLQPGEDADLEVSLHNSGSGNSYDILASIMSDNPYLTVDNASAQLVSLSSNGSGTLIPSFTVTIEDGCPLSQSIPIYLTLTDDMGYERHLLFEIVVGGILDSFENGVGAWTHSNITTGFSDQWTLSTHRNYTYNGSTSWHCGPANGSPYANYLDAGLVSPEYEIMPGATLKFRHWMNAELSPATPLIYCYDGGVVEMSLNGSVFFQIYPVDGYNYYIKNDTINIGPFPPLVQVFSGDIVWEEVVFNLGLFPMGNAHFRFRFGSNNNDQREGWYIDDLEMYYQTAVQAPNNLQAEWADSVTLYLTWNSPGVTGYTINGKPEGNLPETLYNYRVYRNGVLIADDIQSLFYNDNLSSLPSGDYTYTITAVFYYGESEPTEPVTVQYISYGVSGQRDLTPTVYYIKPNFPNPFNPTTAIEYGIPQASEVRLTIYNIQGKQVAVIVDEFQQAGSYTANWDAGGLPSGIYLYHLQAGRFSAHGKMLLLK